MLLSQSPWASVITRAPAAPRPEPALSALAGSGAESGVDDGLCDLDHDGEDLPHDPTRPRGWLVSEKGLETIFRPELGIFADVPPRRRSPRRVGRLLDC